MPLKDALNAVWEVEETKESVLWHFARNYVLSFAAVLALGFLLLVSPLVTAGLAAAGKFIAPYLPEGILQQGLASTYAAAASIVVVLIWVYYTSQIILMGVEITRAYSKRHHHPSTDTRPAPGGVARGRA